LDVILVQYIDHRFGSFAEVLKEAYLNIYLGSKKWIQNGVVVSV